ncbi:MAG: WD40 repeat domain-containing protein [Fuerstiella sp.]
MKVVDKPVCSVLCLLLSAGIAVVATRAAATQPPATQQPTTQQTATQQTATTATGDPNTTSPNTTSPNTAVGITSDGTMVVEASQTGLRVRRWSDLTIVREVTMPCTQIHDLTFTTDEQHLVAAGGEPGGSGFISLLSWPTLQPVWQRELSSDVLYQCAVSADGRSIAAAGHDHSVYLLEAVTGHQLVRLSGHSKPVTTVAFPDDRTLLSGSLDQTIRVWSLDSGQVLRSLTNHTGAVSDLAVCPASDVPLPLIASAGHDKTIRFWQPSIGRLVRFKRVASPTTCVAFTPDGAAVLAGCRDGSVRCIDVVSLATRDYPGLTVGWINCITVHPVERRALVGCSDGTVRKIDIQWNSAP